MVVGVVVSKPGGSDTAASNRGFMSHHVKEVKGLLEAYVESERSRGMVYGYIVVEVYWIAQSCSQPHCVGIHFHS